MNINDIYKTIITDEDNLGNGITRVNNFVIFVPYALKGEEAEIIITKIEKNYAIGRMTKIYKTSLYRKDVLCKYFYTCGGCSFLHIGTNIELEAKASYVKKLLGMNVNVLPSNIEYKYRNKATFHIKNGLLGYYEEGTNDLVAIDYCLLLNDRINEVYEYFKNNRLDGFDELLIRTTDKEILIKISGNKEFYDYKDITSLMKIDSLYVNNKCVYGREFIIDNFNGFEFTIYPNSFYQVNSVNMRVLYDQIYKYAGMGDKLLDLYCGTGTIGMYVSDNYRSITGVEINNDAIRNANINKKLNKINNIDFICSDAKEIKKKSFDTIIVDPPRNGLSGDVIGYLNKSGASKIIYVSCNPNTLKRDLLIMKDYYYIKECSVVNMFVKTKHIETIVLLEKI